MRRRGIAVAVLAAAAAGLAGCGGGSSDAGQTARARGAVLLGVTAGEPISSNPRLAAREVPIMARSGVTTLRAPIYWSNAQPYASNAKVPASQRRHYVTVAGRPTDFSKGDELVAATAKAGIRLLPVVVGTPLWDRRRPSQQGSPPRHPADYAAFVKALVQRYGPDGSFWRAHPKIPKLPVRDWQIWNEPNHVVYWRDQPFAPGYVRLARAARAAIKSVDPGATVVAAGFPDRSWESLAAVYRAGGRDVFDAMAIHPYTFKVANVIRIVRMDRAVMRRFGDGSKPLWLTEVTWSSGRHPGRKIHFPFDTTPADQAAKLSQVLPRLVALRGALGIARIYWESWLSTDKDTANPFDYSGLRALNPDGTSRPKPSFFAYRRIALATKRCLRAHPDAPCG